MFCNKKLQVALLIFIGIALTLIAGEFNYKKAVFSGGEAKEHKWEYDEFTKLNKEKVFETGCNKGEYTLDFTYEISEPTQVTLIDEFANDGNNNLGVVVCQENLPLDYKDLTLDFKLENETPNLALYITNANKGAVVRSYTINKGSASKRPFCYQDIIFILFVIFLITLTLYFLGKEEKRKFWFILFILAVIASLPMMKDGITKGHDTLFHINRILGIAEGISNGQIPVRINYKFNNGYGFANPMFYPELFLYIPAVFCLLGVSVVASFNAFFLPVNVASLFAAYYGFKNLLKDDKLGFIAAILYCFNPYSLTNIYIRMALGEIIASIFLPLFLLGAYEVIFRDYKKWYILVISATCIFQSHMITTLMCAFFFVLMFIFGIKNFICSNGLLRAGALFKTGILTVLVNLWFLLPFAIMYASKNRAIGRSPLKQYSKFAQNIGEIFLYGFAKVDDTNVVGSVGLIPLVGVILYVYYRFNGKIDNDKNKTLSDISIFLGILFCVMSSKLFPWELVNKIDFVRTIFETAQFQFRFLNYVNLFLTIVTVAALNKFWDSKNILKIASIIILISSFSTFALSFMPDYLSKGEFINGKYSYVPCAFYKDYYKTDIRNYIRKNGNVIVAENTKIKNYKKTFGHISFDFEKNIEKDQEIVCPYYNYDKLYKAYLDGEPIPIKYDAALITVDIPKDVQSGRIDIKYENRRIYAVADIITLVTILFIVIYICKKRFNLNRKFNIN